MGALVRLAVELVDQLVGVVLIERLLPRLQLARCMNATNQGRVGAWVRAVGRAAECLDDRPQQAVEVVQTSGCDGSGAGQLWCLRSPLRPLGGDQCLRPGDRIAIADFPHGVWDSLDGSLKHGVAPRVQSAMSSRCDGVGRHREVVRAVRLLAGRVRGVVQRIVCRQKIGDWNNCDHAHAVAPFAVSHAVTSVVS